jgi:hypothetical protein
MGEPDLNIDFGPVDRLGRPVEPQKGKVGRRGTPGWMWFVAGLGTAFVCLALLALLTPNPKATPAPESREQEHLDGMAGAVEIARMFDSHLKSVSPACKTYVDMADVSAPNGFLIVYTVRRYADLNAESRQMLDANIASLWREAKWVKERGWDPRVEIMVPQTEGGFSRHFVE